MVMRLYVILFSTNIDFYVILQFCKEYFMTTVDDKRKGSFIGLFVGDAVGTALEFKVLGEQPRITDMVGGGVFRLNPGEWTDDGAMALCLAKSIIDKKIIDKSDILRLFARWYLYGDNSSNGKCFDIGGTCNRYINEFINTKGMYHDAGDFVWEAGNGSIMRLSPAVIPWYDNPSRAMQAAVDQSITTHGNSEVLQYCAKLANVLLQCYRGEYPEVDLEIKNTPESDLATSGYVVDTYDAAMWAFWNTDNFRDCILAAANLCGDADTIAAVAGQVAGAWYGFSSIPTEWVEKLAKIDELIEVYSQLAVL